MGFNIGISLWKNLNLIIKQLKIPLISVVICTDSKTLLDYLAKLGTISEKRLIIDVMTLRKAYERREIKKFRWIDSKDNPADTKRKTVPNKALERFVDSNRLTIRIEGYVNKPLETSKSRDSG